MKNKKLRISGQTILIILIMLFAFTIRLGLLLVSDDFHGVSNGRVIQAKLILENDLSRGEWYSPVHPPVHLLLLMGGLKVFNNLPVVPRLISLIFGTLLLLPFYYCVKFLFDDHIAVFSMLAAALYSEHIVYSVIATSETCFHFFLFLSLFLFLLFFRRNSIKYLLGSALILGAGSLCRYEGLLFIPLFSLALRKNVKHFVLFTSTACIAPVIWMYINYVYSGDPLQFINTNDFTVPLQFNWIRSQGIQMGFMEKISFWPVSLMNTLGVSMFIFGLAGILHCLFKRKNLFFASIFCFLLAVFIFRTAQERLYIQPRYGITLGLFLIPYSIYFFNRIIKIIEQYTIKIPTVITLLLIGSMIPSINSRISAEPLYAPFFARRIASYLGENIKKGENIIIDHCGDEKYREPIKLLSGINPRQFILMPYLVSKNGRWVADENKFFNVLEKCRVDVLVYSPYGDLKEMLGLEKAEKNAVINNFQFILKYSSGPYMVYRLKKDNLRRGRNLESL